MKSPTSESETAALEHHIEVAKTMTVGTAGKGGCALPSPRSPAPALKLLFVFVWKDPKSWLSNRTRSAARARWIRFMREWGMVE